MNCKCAIACDEYHGWRCDVTDGECMFLMPNSRSCAEQFGEGPDAQIHDHLNKITICSDGDIKRLIDYEKGYVYYDVPIDISNGRITWMKLGKVYRGQVEDKFLKGKIVTEDECKAFILEGKNH